MKNAVILGSFDGVHLGHKAVIDAADGYNRIAVTFLLPPKMTLSGKRELLLSNEDKLSCLKHSGINEVVELEFSDYRDKSAEEFFIYIKEHFSPSLIVCGFNYRFGKDAAGDAALLSELCLKNGIEFKSVPCVSYEGAAVSSSSIRALIKRGDIAKANCLLGRDFSFTATVLHGDKRGRTIGFPTVNQKYPEGLVLPRFGVYHTEIAVNGKTYKSISNFGVRPTFKTLEAFCETYIKDFSDDVYGAYLTVSFKSFIRDERKFANIEELKSAIQKDIGIIL